jgi:hypothetical protein
VALVGWTVLQGLLVAREMLILWACDICWHPKSLSAHLIVI